MSSNYILILLLINFILFFRNNLLYAKYLEPITVKSDAMDLQDISIKSQNKKNLLNLEQALIQSPNINFVGGTNKTRYYIIRGQGERSQYGAIPSHSIGFFFNNIEFSGLASTIPISGVQDLKLTKTPDAINWGSHSALGRIALDTNFEISKSNLMLALANYNTQVVQLNYQTKLASNYFLVASLSSNTSDTPYFNEYLMDTTNKQNEFFASLGFKYKQDKLNLQHHHIFANNRNGYDVWSINSPTFKTQSDRPGVDNQRSHGHSLLINYELSPKLKLTSINSISLNNINYSYDEDWGNNIYWNQIPSWNIDYDYFKSYIKDKIFWHQKSTFEYQVNQNILANMGVHLYGISEDGEIKSYKNNQLKETLLSHYNSNHVGFFTGLTYSFVKNWHLETEIRTETQNLKYDDSTQFNSSVRYKNLLAAKIRLEKGVSTTTSLFAQFDQSFKGGGYNPDLNLTDNQKNYLPERIFNFEIGGKHSYIKHKFDWNLFYLIRNRLQLQKSIQTNPSDPGSFVYYTDNASSSSSYGVEMIYQNEISKILNLDLSVGLLNSEFKDYQYNNESYNGRALPYAPNYNFTIGNGLSLSKNLKLYLQIFLQDSFYFSDDHNLESEAYELVNMHLEYKINNLNFKIWSKNMFNKNYAVRGFYFANEPPDWRNKLYVQNGDPISFGIGLNVFY